MRILITTIVLTLLLSESCCPLYAEFILDDFDDVAELKSPEMEGELVETANVGDLSSTRKVSIFDVLNDPIARLDVNRSAPSALSAEVSPASTLGFTRLGASYSFDGQPIDFTESGANNAVLIDVNSIDGMTPPPLFYSLVRDGGLLYEGFARIISSSPTPSTVPLAFENFRERAGGSRTTDFQSVSWILIEVFGNGTINGVQEQGWSIEIESIRVGRVPETVSITLLGLAGITFASFRRWHRQS